MERATKACFSCRTRKRRCDTALPSCSHCLEKHLECIYPATLKRRGPGQIKQKLQLMENKLNSLESFIGKSSESRQVTDACAEQSSSLQSQLTAVECDDNNNTNNQSFKPITDYFSAIKSSWLGDDSKFDTLVKAKFASEDAVQKQVMRTLPEMLQEIPVLDLKDLVLPATHVRLDAHLTTSAKAPLFATRYAVIAITYLGKIANSSYGEMAPISWSTFKSAIELLPLLLLSPLDLGTVQAVVLMAYYAGFSADARLTSLLLANAAKLSELFKASGRGQSCPPTFSVFAIRAFWSTFIMESELSLHQDQPSMPARDGFDLDLSDLTRTPGSGLEGIIFGKRAQLSRILVTIRQRLHSTRPGDSKATLQDSIQFLDANLRQWRTDLPTELWSGTSRDSVGEFTDMPIMFLKLTFHNGLSMVHWAGRGIAQKDSEVACSNATNRLQIHRITEYRISSRAILSLLNERPPLQFSYFWRTLSFGISAALTLLACIVESPAHSEDVIDFELLKAFSAQVSAMNAIGDYNLSALLTTCEAMLRIAQEAFGTGSSASPEVEALRQAFRSVSHPMFVAQDMLTNIRTRDARISELIGEILQVSFSGTDGYSSLVPDYVKAGTFFKL